MGTAPIEESSTGFVDPTGDVTIDEHVERFGEPDGGALARAHVDVVDRQGFGTCAAGALDPTDANLTAHTPASVQITVDGTDPLGVAASAYTVSFAATTGKADVDVTMHVWILQRADLVLTIAITATGLRGQSRGLLDAVDAAPIIRAAVARLRGTPYR